MTRARLSWLIAVPLMMVGSFAARAATYVCLPEQRGETGNEAAERLQAGAHDVQWPVLLGVVAALTVVSLALQVRSLVAGHRTRAVSAGTFFWLPPLAFVAQEVAERVIQGNVDLEPGTLHRLAVGLAMQLPFALLAFAVSYLLLAAASRIAGTILASKPPSRLAATIVAVGASRLDLPTRWLFPRGHPTRGPPVTTS